MNGDDKPNVLGELYGVVRFQHVREVLLELDNIFLHDGKFVLDTRLDTFSFPEKMPLSTSLLRLNFSSV